MNWFIQGGWPMYPILFCSVTALAVTLERAIYLARSFEQSGIVIEALRRGKPAGKGYLSKLADIYKKSVSLSPAEFEEKLHQEGSRMLQKLERGLGFLSAIAHLAPLLGLFGTVLGMIGVFKGIEQSGGKADMQFLAGGIWVALLTTAFGLAVAIPSMAAYHLFDGLIRRRSAQMQDFAAELNNLFGRSCGIDVLHEQKSVENPEKDYETIHAV